MHAGECAGAVWTCFDVEQHSTIQGNGCPPSRRECCSLVAVDVFVAVSSGTRCSIYSGCGVSAARPAHFSGFRRLRWWSNRSLRPLGCHRALSGRFTVPESRSPKRVESGRGRVEGPRFSKALVGVKP